MTIRLTVFQFGASGINRLFDNLISPDAGGGSKRIFYVAIYGELPVYKASYDLLLDILRFIKDFRRDYK